jgi:hypothetical protein
MANFKVAVLAGWLAAGSVAAQDAKLEDRVKATFIFNFAQYAEWPPSAFASTSSFTICIVGDSFLPVMQETVRGDTLNGRNIVVKSLASVDNALGCHVIYFHPSAEHKTVAEVLVAVKASPILTVGESQEFIRNGGIIRFTRAGTRIRFEINPAAAERRSLSLSARLLRLADIVRAP